MSGHRKGRWRSLYRLIENNELLLDVCYYCRGTRWPQGCIVSVVSSRDHRRERRAESRKERDRGQLIVKEKRRDKEREENGMEAKRRREENISMDGIEVNDRERNFHFVIYFHIDSHYYHYEKSNKWVMYDHLLGCVVENLRYDSIGTTVSDDHMMTGEMSSRSIWIVHETGTGRVSIGEDVTSSRIRRRRFLSMHLLQGESRISTSRRRQHDSCFCDTRIMKQTKREREKKQSIRLSWELLSGKAVVNCFLRL